jgi:hypothetical protein
MHKSFYGAPYDGVAWGLRLFLYTTDSRRRRTCIRCDTNERASVWGDAVETSVAVFVTVKLIDIFNMALSSKFS